MWPYPGGMSKTTRNRLWFHEHSQTMSESVLNEFVAWVGNSQPVQDWHWTRALDKRSIDALWSKFARSKTTTSARKV